MSPRSDASCSAEPIRHQISPMSARVASAAGMRRRRRRAQNLSKSIEWEPSNSRTRRFVIRNPESVKNVETPRKPPSAQVKPPWNNSTPMTAMPRIPSRAGKWGREAERSDLSVSGEGWLVVLSSIVEPRSPQGRRPAIDRLKVAGESG